MIIILTILILCGLIIIALLKNNEEKSKINSNIQELLETQETLQKKIKAIDAEIDKRKEVSSVLSRDIDRQEIINEQLNKAITEKNRQLQLTIKDNKEISDQAFNEYFSLLNKQYDEIEQEYDKKIDILNQDYNNKTNILQEEIKTYTQELEKLKQTKAAAYQALLKEQEIKENKDNYRLKPTDNDLADARRLNLIQRELHKPRILAMLIWQTYWQPLAKRQFPIILQDKTKCGIYKITNLVTDSCYIGQSLDIYKRWSEHCKCGLGIDTPPGNKLYQAMLEYGLENFTFELLEECTPAELNEKEKYFIELYLADTYGYNSQGGNKR